LEIAVKDFRDSAIVENIGIDREARARLVIERIGGSRGERKFSTRDLAAPFAAGIAPERREDSPARVHPTRSRIYMRRIQFVYLIYGSAR